MDPAIQQSAEQPSLSNISQTKALTDLNKTYIYNAKFTQFVFDLLDETSDPSRVAKEVETYLA